MSDHATSRRTMIYGAAAAGVAIPLLAACGSGAGEADVTGTAEEPTQDPTQDSQDSTSGNGGGESSDGTILKTSDVPEGGGTILADELIVVTQPKAGEFKAFSAVCTHQQCPVTEVKDGEILCPCHFSKFSIEDGSVLDGPAPKPLPERTVTVAGDELSVS